MSCVCLGARVSYIVCLCMLSSLEDSKFEGDLCGSGAFPADRWSFTDTGHTWSQVMQLPDSSRYHFCRDF